ncbi:MAG: deoxyguanosinetriphosphate triphosphohydrolase [Christensenellaceae bacterium]|jgi:dGTPase|nr:deoxyguanosinetriphosphate triphosphohydrolase [Christensenellaceae bacterium]
MQNNYIEFENLLLSQYAKRSCETLGRQIYIESCPLRTEFQRDRDRIIHCKAFRRLKHKTQVFLSPHGDHYRTRLTHTLEVTQISRTIARALRLNEDLTEAIALGHDLGHTPFGHIGERTLDSLTGHFKHNEQSLRVVDLLENDGRGLNLTYEVRDGIINHCISGTPSTLEGSVVSISDRIAYINHDIDDAIRGGLLSENDLPCDIISLLGNKRGNMIDKFITDVVTESYEKNQIKQSEQFENALLTLRKFMFERVYDNPVAKIAETKTRNLITLLFNHYAEHPEYVPNSYKLLSDSKTTYITDYIAGMSDNYAIKAFNDIYVPSSWENL